MSRSLSPGSAFSSAREKGAADRDDDLGNIERYLRRSKRFIGPGTNMISGSVSATPLLSYLSVESETATSSLQPCTDIFLTSIVLVCECTPGDEMSQPLPFGGERLPSKRSLIIHLKTGISFLIR